MLSEVTARSRAVMALPQLFQISAKTETKQNGVSFLSPSFALSLFRSFPLSLCLSFALSLSSVLFTSASLADTRGCRA